MKASERRRFEKMSGRRLAAEGAKPRPPRSALTKRMDTALALAADIEEFRRTLKSWSGEDLARVWLVAHLLRLWAAQTFSGSETVRDVLLDEAQHVADHALLSSSPRSSSRPSRRTRSPDERRWRGLSIRLTVLGEDEKETRHGA